MSGTFLTSFLSFVNGPLENKDGVIEYRLTNSNSEKSSGLFHIGKIHPFETKLLYFSEHILHLTEYLGNINIVVILKSLPLSISP